MFECRISIGRLPDFGGMYARVLKRFEVEAGALVVTAVQDELGKDDLYKLSEAYAALKPRMPGYKRVAGKDPDQPLIFTGDMFDNVAVRIEGGMVVIEIAEGHGDSEKGFDYAEFWESGQGGKSFEGVHYMERAFAVVEPLLADLLTQIISEEMFA